MARIIINHTNPNQSPVTGDWIEIQEGNSSIKKQHWEAPTEGEMSLNSFGEVVQYQKGYWLTAEEIATELAREMRAWRDDELLLTDFIVPLSDHPQRAAYMTYRTALRDWPSTGDFPDTKPTL
jgi:hypothetical protein